MAIWHSRDLHDPDIERVVQLLERTRHLPDTTPIDLVELIGAMRTGQPGVVAVAADGQVVGFVIAGVQGDRCWLTALAIDPQWRNLGIGSALLSGIEERLLHLGVRRIVALLGPGQVGETALRKRGFRATSGLVYYEKDEPLRPAEISILDAWGGALIESGAWAAVAGMAEVKQLIESRVLGPLLEPERAQAYGLRAPATVMLFGPPGTGKTTFARAIAARLGWPFVELLPSKLAGAEAGLAVELHRAFFELANLEHVVAFIDEFDEIASNRTARPDMQSVVNQLLKAIPPFRSQPGRLLVCATNFIETLDHAIVRPGRFDLILPVGPPNAEAREAIWRASLAAMSRDSIDFDELVTATERFTPADLALAAQRAAFIGFERAKSTGRNDPVTTTDVLAAIEKTPPSLSLEVMVGFREMSERFARD